VRVLVSASSIKVMACSLGHKQTNIYMLLGKKGSVVTY
jgi:hypothetical protein